MLLSVCQHANGFGVERHAPDPFFLEVLTTVDYRSFLTKHRLALGERHSKNEDLRPADIFAGIDFDQDNRALFNWAQRERLATPQDVRDARRRAAIVVTLGEYPATPVEFVNVLARQLDVRVRFNGAVTRLNLATGERIDLLSTDFARECRSMSASLQAGFNRADIDDAVEGWYQEERRNRVSALREQIAPRAEFDWEMVARTCFNCTETSPAFVAAVLKKFVHQVVCKLHRRPVGHHLMPVLTGRQGGGKTYFLNHLFGPLAELTRTADFKAISDERMIDLWRSYIIFIDEMGYAERSDVDIVKNVITAETVDRRPMRTNGIQTVRQCATLIGASNKSLSELIRDETGNRRFVAIEYSPPEDRNFIASLDWAAAWQSVKQTDADPMDAHRDILTAMQEAERHFGPVEAWLRALDSGEAALGHLVDAKLRTQDLYETFLSHRRTVTADYDPVQRTQDAFAKELNRVMGHNPDICPLHKSRDSKGVLWTWTSPRPLSLVQGGLA